MNADHPDLTPAPSTPAPSAESPGQTIRRAREAAGYSLDELATQTKLARATLDALERDDFDALLEPVYVRGYYRKCAKVLGLPEQQLIGYYASRVTQKAPPLPDKLRLGTGSDFSAGRGGRSLLILIVVIGLAATAIWYLRGQRGASMPPLLQAPSLPATTSKPAGTAPAPEPQTQAPAPAPAESGMPAAPDASAAVVSEVPSALPAAAEPAPAVASASATVTTSPATPAAAPAASPSAAPTAAEPAAPASASASALKLNFVQISWARIEDANGRVLLNRVVQGGERQVLDGKPPYTVFLGNAPGVQIEYEGRPLDFKALIRDTATARFSVPLAPRPAATTP